MCGCLSHVFRRVEHLRINQYHWARLSQQNHIILKGTDPRPPKRSPSSPSCAYTFCPWRLRIDSVTKGSSDPHWKLETQSNVDQGRTLVLLGPHGGEPDGLGICSGSLPGEGFQAHPMGRKPQGRTRTCWRDNVSDSWDPPGRGRAREV